MMLFAHQIAVLISGSHGTFSDKRSANQRMMTEHIHPLPEKWTNLPLLSLSFDLEKHQDEGNLESPWLLA